MISEKPDILIDYFGFAHFAVKPLVNVELLNVPHHVQLNVVSKL